MDVYPYLRPLLAHLEPETAHRLTLRALNMGAHRLWPATEDPAELSVSAFGLDFPNPLGIAAGFDKDGEASAGLLALGFGFVELGTVTPRAQPGNPKPRLFRLEEDKAVINRMGFNNKGAPALAVRFARHRPAGLIGISIGANKDSADRMLDYQAAYRSVAPYADYIAINVSSPNTVGLRGLQERDQLETLIRSLQAIRAEEARALPLLVKIAPDLDHKALEDVAEIAHTTNLDGLIISNTTLGEREGLKSVHRGEPGGLSGMPLFRRSTEVLAEVYRLTEGRIPLIGVGGIASPRDAYEKILAGATLLQLYTALVYQGPGLVRRLREGLRDLLKADGFSCLTQAIGARNGATSAQALARSA